MFKYYKNLYKNMYISFANPEASSNLNDVKDLNKNKTTLDETMEKALSDKKITKEEYEYVKNRYEKEKNKISLLVKGSIDDLMNQVEDSFKKDKVDKDNSNKENKDFSIKNPIDLKYDWVKNQIKDGIDFQKPTKEQILKILELYTDVKFSKVKNTPENSAKAIYAIQTSLSSLGFGANLGKIDGLYGDNTKKAITEFQSKNNIKDDGVPGKETVKKLITALGGTLGVDISNKDEVKKDEKPKAKENIRNYGSHTTNPEKVDLLPEEAVKQKEEPKEKVEQKGKNEPKKDEKPKVKEEPKKQEKTVNTPEVKKGRVHDVLPVKKQEKTVDESTVIDGEEGEPLPEKEVKKVKKQEKPVEAEKKEEVKVKTTEIKQESFSRQEIAKLELQGLTEKNISNLKNEGFEVDTKGLFIDGKNLNSLHFKNGKFSSVKNEKIDMSGSKIDNIVSSDGVTQINITLSNQEKDYYVFSKKEWKDVTDKGVYESTLRAHKDGSLGKIKEGFKKVEDAKVSNEESENLTDDQKLLREVNAILDSEENIFKPNDTTLNKLISKLIKTNHIDTINQLKTRIIKENLGDHGKNVLDGKTYNDIKLNSVGGQVKVITEGKEYNLSAGGYLVYIDHKDDGDTSLVGGKSRDIKQNIQTGPIINNGGTLNIGRVGN